MKIPRFLLGYRPNRLKKFVFYTAVLKNRISNNKEGNLILPKVVSHKYKLVYVHNPLVASNTIKSILRSLDENAETTHANPLSYRSYLKFSFVRNPIERVLSCYTKKVLNADTAPKLYVISKYKGLHYNMSLREFVDWLLTEEGSDKYADRHWISQHKILHNSKGEPLYDYLGKLETFKEDLNRLLGFTPEIPRLVTSNQQPKKCQEEITDDMRNKILRRYGKDFVKFNYRVEQEVIT